MMGIWGYRPKTNMMQVKGMQVSDVTDFWQVFNGCCLLRGSAVALWGCDSRDSHGFPYTLVVGSSSKSASGCPEGRDRSLHQMKQQTCSIHSTWIPLRVIAKSEPQKYKTHVPHALVLQTMELLSCSWSVPATPVPPADRPHEPP